VGGDSLGDYPMSLLDCHPPSPQTKTKNYKNSWWLLDGLLFRCGRKSIEQPYNSLLKAFKYILLELLIMKKNYIAFCCKILNRLAF